jgi:hypothetical protein
VASSFFAFFKVFLAIVVPPFGMSCLSDAFLYAKGVPMPTEKCVGAKVLFYNALEYRRFAVFLGSLVKSVEILTAPMKKSACNYL